MAQAPGPRTPSGTPPRTPSPEAGSGLSQREAMRGRMQATHVSVPPGFERHFASPESSVSASAGEQRERKVAAVSVAGIEALEEKLSKASDFKVFLKDPLIDVQTFLENECEWLDQEKKLAILEINKAIDERGLGPETVLIGETYEGLIERPEIEVVKQIFDVARFENVDLSKVVVQIKTLEAIRGNLHGVKFAELKQIFGKIWFYKVVLFFKVLMVYGKKSYCPEEEKGKLMAMMLYGCHNDLHSLLPVGLIEELLECLNIENFETRHISIVVLITGKFEEYIFKRKQLEMYAIQLQREMHGQTQLPESSVTDEAYQKAMSVQGESTVALKQVVQEWNYESTKKKVIDLLCDPEVEDSIDITLLPGRETLVDSNGDIFPDTISVLQYIFHIGKKNSDPQCFSKVSDVINRSFKQIHPEDKAVVEAFLCLRAFQCLGISSKTLSMGIGDSKFMIDFGVRFLREQSKKNKGLFTSIYLGTNILEKVVERLEFLKIIDHECEDVRLMLFRELEVERQLESVRLLVSEVAKGSVDSKRVKKQAKSYQLDDTKLLLISGAIAERHELLWHYQMVVVSWCHMHDMPSQCHILTLIEKNLAAHKIPRGDVDLLKKMWLISLIKLFSSFSEPSIFKEFPDLFERVYLLIKIAVENDEHQKLSGVLLEPLRDILEITSNWKDEAIGLYQSVYNAWYENVEDESSSEEQTSDEERGATGSYDVTTPQKSDKAVTVKPQSTQVKQADLSKEAASEVQIKICGYERVDIKQHLETQCDELDRLLYELHNQKHRGLGPYRQKEQEVKSLIAIVGALENQTLRPGIVSVEPSWGYMKQTFIDACYRKQYLEESDVRGIIFHVAGLPDENIEQGSDYVRQLSQLQKLLGKIQQPVYRQLFMWSWFYKVMPLFNRFVLSEEESLMTTDERKILVDLVKFGFCFNAHFLVGPDWLKQVLDKEESEWFPVVDKATRSYIMKRTHEYFESVEKKKSSLVEVQHGQELTGQQDLPSDQEESDSVSFTQFWSPAHAMEEVEKILWDRQYESTIKESCLPPLNYYETENGGVREDPLDIIMNLLLIRYRVKENSIIGEKLESIQIAIDNTDVRDRELLSAFFLYRLIDFWEYFFNHETPRAIVWSYIELISEMVRWTLVRGIHQSQYIKQWFLEKSLRLLDRLSQHGVENYKDIQEKISYELWGRKLDKTVQLTSQLVNDEIEDSEAANRTKDEPLNVERALTVMGDEFNSYELHEHFLYVLLCWYRPVSNESRLKIFESVLRNVFDQDIFDDDIRDLLLRLLLIRITQYSDWITPQKVKDKDACTNQLLGIVKLSVEHDIQERLPFDRLKVLHEALVCISNAEDRKDGGEGEIIDVALAKRLSESVARSLRRIEERFSDLLPTSVEQISDDESSIESSEDTEFEIDDVESFVDNILMKRESDSPALMIDLGNARGKYLSFIGKHKEFTHENVTDILNYLLRIDYEISEAEDVENALRPVQSVIPCIAEGEDHQRCAKLFMHMMIVNLQRLYIYQCTGKSLDEYEVECLELFAGYLNWCFEQGFNQWFERDEVDHVLGVLNYFQNRQIILISDSMKIIVDDYVIRKVMDTYYEGENIELESDQSIRHLTLEEVTNNDLPASLSPQEGAEAAICNEIVFGDKTVPIVEIIEQLLWGEDAKCPIAFCRTTTCASRLFKRMENNAFKIRFYRNMFLHAIESHRASETAFVVKNLPESKTSDFHQVVKDGLMYIQQLRLMCLRTPTVELQDQDSRKDTSIPEGMAMRRYFRAEAFNSALQAKANCPGGAIPLEECGIISGPEWRNQLSGLILSGEVDRVMNLENIAASKPVPFWRHIDTKDIRVDIKFVCNVCLHYQRQPVDQRDAELYENYKLLVNQFHNDSPRAFWLVNNDTDIQSKIAIFSLLSPESRQNLNEVAPDSLMKVVVDNMCIRYPRDDVGIRQIKNQANELLRRRVRATNWQSLVRIYVQLFYGKSNPITKPEMNLIDRLENRLQRKSADLLSFDSLDNDYNLSCLEAIYWHKLWNGLTI